MELAEKTAYLPLQAHLAVFCAVLAGPRTKPNLQTRSSRDVCCEDWLWGALWLPISSSDVF
jgi:hypothetical protein